MNLYQIPEYLDAIAECDQTLAPLLEACQEQGVAVVVTTDHGGTARESMPASMTEAFFTQGWTQSQIKCCGLHGMPDEGENALIPHWQTFQCYYDPNAEGGKEILPTPTNLDVARRVLELATLPPSTSRRINAVKPQAAQLLAAPRERQSVIDDAGRDECAKDSKVRHLDVVDWLHILLTGGNIIILLIATLCYHCQPLA